MSAGSPLDHIWWLVSRASGVVALGAVSLSVLLGLALAAKALPSSRRRSAAGLHEQLALLALTAITAHALALLGDGWLAPGWRGIAVPFALHYRSLFSGLGVIAAYLAFLLGPSFYLRKRIGARRWRQMHRLTVAIWVLGVVHALGTGTDGAAIWLRVVALLPLPGVVYLLVLRALAPRPHAVPAVGRPLGTARGGRHGVARRPVSRELEPEGGAASG